MKTLIFLGSHHLLQILSRKLSGEITGHVGSGQHVSGISCDNNYFNMSVVEITNFVFSCYSYSHRI